VIFVASLLAVLALGWLLWPRDEPDVILEGWDGLYDTVQNPVTVHDGGLLTGRGVWLPPFGDEWTLPDVLGTIDDIDRLGRVEVPS